MEALLVPGDMAAAAGCAEKSQLGAVGSSSLLWW